MNYSPDIKTVAVSRVDGGVTVLRVIENEYGPDGEIRKHHEVTQDYVERLIAKYNWQGPLAPVSWEFVPNDYIDDNTDTSYRNAWKHNKGGKKPDHDMVKARELQRIHLRKARFVEFCRLDNEYRIADEAGDVKAKREIGALRQKFRDVTAHPNIEAAQTVDELKKLRLKTLVPETTGDNYMDKMRLGVPLSKQNKKEV
jgi:hypothetical protein